jgi:hypothetical protein
MRWQGGSYLDPSTQIRWTCIGQFGWSRAWVDVHIYLRRGSTSPDSMGSATDRPLLQGRKRTVGGMPVAHGALRARANV